jgi:hypothetical protein
MPARVRKGPVAPGAPGVVLTLLGAGAVGTILPWRAFPCRPDRCGRAGRPTQATYGSEPDSLTMGRPAEAQPCMPSDTLIAFQPPAPRAWAA